MKTTSYFHLASAALFLSPAAVASATGPGGGKSFVDDFKRLDTSRCYVSDGRRSGMLTFCRSTPVSEPAESRREVLSAGAGRPQVRLR